MESSLYLLAKRFLEKLGFVVKGEVSGCDLVALDIIAELYRRSSWRRRSCTRRHVCLQTALVMCVPGSQCRSQSAMDRSSSAFLAIKAWSAVRTPIRDFAASVGATSATAADVPKPMARTSKIVRISGLSRL